MGRRFSQAAGSARPAKASHSAHARTHTQVAPSACTRSNRIARILRAHLSLVANQAQQDVFHTSRVEWIRALTTPPPPPPPPNKKQLLFSTFPPLTTTTTTSCECTFGPHARSHSHGHARARDAPNEANCCRRRAGNARLFSFSLLLLLFATKRGSSTTDDLV